MFNSAREIFQKMNYQELLSTASFFKVEYAPETLDMLKEIAVERGITDETVRQYRESCYVEFDFEFKCNVCNSELTLDKEDFIKGIYTCPDCNATNMINTVNATPIRWNKNHLLPAFG